MSLKMLCLAVAVAAVSVGAAQAQNLGSSTGAVFVATNSAKGNAIIMYKRGARGDLSRVGEFATGGRGQGGVNDPQQSSYSILLSPDHSYLLAVNAGSGDISVFRVLPTGLALMSVTPSGGGNPVSLAMYDDLVYVVNAGGVVHTAGFRMTANGQLKPIEHSRKTLSSLDPGAGTVEFVPGGSQLVVIERLTNKIDVFTVNPDGSLSNPVFNASAGLEPFSTAFTPTGEMLVAEAASGSVSSYTVNANNTLSTITAKSPSGGGATCWIATTGTYAWTSNSISSDLTDYSVSGGALAPISLTGYQPAAGPTKFPDIQPATSYPLDVALSQDNHYLYAFYSGNGEVVGYKVGDTGRLTQVSSVYPETPQTGAEGLAAF